MVERRFKSRQSAFRISALNHYTTCIEKWNLFVQGVTIIHFAPSLGCQIDSWTSSNNSKGVKGCKSKTGELEFFLNICLTLKLIFPIKFLKRHRSYGSLNFRSCNRSKLAEPRLPAQQRAEEAPTMVL